MNIQQATRLYEHWLGQKVELIRADIRHKHRLMASDVFRFFRATFYRWMQLWPEACFDLADARVVLAVGDLHVENYGTWRDQEGRLLSDWRGGMIAREAKALAPSACSLALAWAESPKIYYQEIIEQAVRVPDPFVSVQGKWIVRRLAPDCTRVELGDLPEGHDESALLHAMGYETANIHLGTKLARSAIAHDLRKRPKDWLHKAVKRMAKLVMADWTDWRAVVRTG